MSNSKRPQSEGGLVSRATASTSAGPRRSLASTSKSVSETRLSLLSHAPGLPRWSFGKESRFCCAGDRAARSESSGAHRPPKRPSTVPVDFGKATSKDSAGSAGSPRASRAAVAEDEVTDEDPEAERASSSGFAESDDTALVPVGYREAPGVRLDFTVNRFDDPPGQRQHAKFPKPVSYTPATVIGEGFNPGYFPRDPTWSFGCRLEPKAPKKKGMTQAQKDTHRQKALEQIARNKEANKKVMSRSFGSMERFQLKGGPLQLPFSPGPAAYDLYRDGDEQAEWSAASRIPWGVRTASRQGVVNHTETDVGPGEHCAGHSFSGLDRPCPKFGHPQRALIRESDKFPGPARYAIKSTMGEGPSSIVLGHKESIADLLVGRSPGPAEYSHDGPCVPHRFHTTFGDAERRTSQDVDPDEPPGPGAHQVRKDPLQWSFPHPGLPKSEKLKVVPGMLPPWSPLPGAHSPKLLPNSTSTSFHGPLPLPPHLLLPKTPGPGEYDWEPAHAATKERAAEWGPMAARTQVRRSEFDRNGSAEQTDAQIARAAAAVEKQMEAEGRGMKQRDDYKFVPKGPKYSMQGRQKPAKAPELGATMYGAVSSIA